MFERFLTGGKNSRYRRAGAIGLMVSFFINYIILGLPEQVRLVGQYDLIPRMAVTLLAGAVGGAIWGAAWQPRRALRGALVIGSGYVLARLAVYPLSRAFEGLSYAWQSVLYLLIVALMGIIMSVTAAVGMGVLDSPQKGWRLVGFGALGFLVGRLAYDVINIGYTLVAWLILGNRMGEINPWFIYGFGVLGAALQGYISGSWLGSACQPTVTPTAEGVPATS